jgi:hypothetical protein
VKAAGFVEKRTGEGSHVLFVHPESGKEMSALDVVLVCRSVYLPFDERSYIIWPGLGCEA